MTTSTATLHDWLAYPAKFQKYDELFFILLEAQTNNIEYEFSIYKKIFHKLNNELRNSEISYTVSTNIYGVKKEKHSKEIISEIISCIELIGSKYSARLFIEAEDLYFLEKNGGKYILDQNNISLNTKGFNNYKLKKILISNYNTDFTKEKLHLFIEEIKTITQIADPNILLDYKNKNIQCFCASIALGHQPSQPEVLNMFSDIWNTLNKNSLNLHFFCEYFAQTNVFLHSLAPAKNINKLLKKFFNNLLIDNSNPYTLQGKNLMPLEHKLNILLNHPAFLYENIQKLIIRDYSEILLGKSNITKEEEKLVLTNMNENKEVKTKRLKI